MKFSELTPSDGQRISVAGRVLRYDLDNDLWWSGEKAISRDVLAFLQDAEVEELPPVGAPILAKDVKEAWVGKRVSLSLEGVIGKVDVVDSLCVRIEIGNQDYWFDRSTPITILD